MAKTGAHGTKQLMTPHRYRRGVTILEIAAGVLILTLLTSIVAYAYLNIKERAYTRLCHAQQRSLQKQIDSLGPINLDVPIEVLLGQLVTAGLLQGTLGPDGKSLASLKLTDPGMGDGSYGNFLLLPGSRLMSCDVHSSAFLADD